MRRRPAPLHALSALLVCRAAFGQAKQPSDAEAWREDEGEFLDADDLAPGLARSTERAPALPVRLSLVAWHRDALPLAIDRGVGVALTVPLERAFGLARPSRERAAGLAPPFAAPPAGAAPDAFAPPAAAERPAPADGAPAPFLPLSGAAGPAGLLPFERVLGPSAPLAHLPAAGPGAQALPAQRPLVAAPGLASLAAEPPRDGGAALHVSAADVRALSDAALRNAGLAPRAEGRLDGLASRARSSAVLPELRLRGVQSNDQALRLSYTEADPYRTQTSGGSALLLEARATWRLDRLLYADDEVAVERLRGEVREQRQRLVLKLVEAIGAWQKAQLVLLDPEAAPRERAAAMGQAAGASVLLDALSAGAWSRLRGRDAAGAQER